jgi:hypothetical protein
LEENQEKIDRFQDNVLDHNFVSHCQLRPCQYVFNCNPLGVGKYFLEAEKLKEAVRLGRDEGSLEKDLDRDIQEREVHQGPAYDIWVLPFFLLLVHLVKVEEICDRLEKGHAHNEIAERHEGSANNSY